MKDVMHADVAPPLLTDNSPLQPRLLVADDSSIERTALAHFLRDSGYAVIEAEDGKSTLSHLKNETVDLLVLDLNMPQADGFEVLKYLQVHRRALPVVLLSGMEVDEIQQKMHRLKEQELPPLLLKPIDPSQLLQVLDLQLSGSMPQFPPSEIAPPEDGAADSA